MKRLLHSGTALVEAARELTRSYNLTVTALSIVLTLAAFALTSASAAAPAGPAGHWEGAITLPTTALTIRVDLQPCQSPQTTNAWQGTIDIPAQSLRGFALSAVTVDGSTIAFAMFGIPGDPTFRGILSLDAKSISGDFTQAGQKFPFRLERKTKTEIPGETPSQGIKGTGLAGFWQGSLKPTPVIELRLSLELTNRPSGETAGVLISLDQGASRITLSAITNRASHVQFAAESIGGSFDGRLADNGSEMAGEWRQGGRGLPLVFKRLAKAPHLARPQEPKNPYPYREQEITITNGSPGVTLAGTLTLPLASNAPCPGVVFITGSGPQDRDEAIMGHRPFLVLADYLTRHGIAVLRCDDRGVGKSTGNFAQATHQDFVVDTLAAFTYLKTRKEVDPDRIGLLGHSEGGIIAPLAAMKRPDVAFLVLIAGVGVPVEELLVRQGRDIALLMGTSEETIAANAEVQGRVFAIVKSTDDRATAEKKLRDLLAEQTATLTDAQREAIGLTPDGITAQVKTVLSPWFRALLAYDPRPTLRAVKCPVLAINGEKDVQVAARENLDSIRDSLAAGGNRRVKTVALPGLNHLLQKCQTGAVSEYGTIEETMNPAALSLIVDWIAEAVASSRL